MRRGIFCANFGRTAKPLRILFRIIIPKNADYVKDFTWVSANSNTPPYLLPDSLPFTEQSSLNSHVYGVYSVNYRELE